MMEKKYVIESKIWIKAGNEELLGKGRVSLLKAIEDQGSLSKAAKAVGMSYKRAWTLVDTVNRSAEREVVAKIVGGPQGGGSALTPYGKKLVEAFEQINANCGRFLDEQLTIIEELQK